MSVTVLFVLTSHDQLGNSGNGSGNWLEEFASPYWAFRDAGFNVRFASPKGGAAPLDPLSVKDMWMTDSGKRFMADDEAQKALKSTQKLADVKDDGLDAIYLVGGAATTWDFPHDDDIKRLVEALHARSKVIAGICHGVIGLARVTDAFGQSLVKNRMVTGISNAEDIMMGIDKIVPVLPEDMLRRSRALYMAGPPLSEHVVCDPPFFTGQNPMSAPLLARKIVAHLQQQG